MNGSAGQCTDGWVNRWVFSGWSEKKKGSVYLMTGWAGWRAVLLQHISPLIANYCFQVGFQPQVRTAGTTGINYNCILSSIRGTRVPSPTRFTTLITPSLLVERFRAL